jgi:3-deoxy-D-manno-octulosonic-acid transferase
VSNPGPFALRAYRGASQLLRPLAGSFLASRQRRGKEDEARIGERKGVASMARPDGLLVWLHGASVGEVISLLPVVEYVRARGHGALVTSGTVTSAAVAARRLPEGAIHQYLPLDVQEYVDRFLDHWKPDIGLFAESELWPNLIVSASNRNTHLMVVNARMSERSFRRWKSFPSAITDLLRRFELCLAQTAADAERLTALGAPRVSAVGNLKFDVTPPPADPVKLESLQNAVAGRPLLVAASTHPGEEDIAARAHLAAKTLHPNLLTIIVPRHPERGADLAHQLFRMGLGVCRRSEGVLPDRHTDIYIADTIGEMGLFYRLGRIAFVGGSFSDRGGQNPIEAAKLGAAVLHGPDVRNFRDIYASLDAAGASLALADPAALEREVIRLLRDKVALDRMTQAGRAIVADMSGAVNRTIAALEPLMIQAELGRRG